MTQPPDAIPVVYKGDAASLFPVAFGTGLLSVATLGVYRFWAKARIRRLIWSNIRLGDDSLEFTGSGTEMFLGFLTALVVMALYLSVVQLLLASFGIRIIFAPETPVEKAMQAASFGLSFAASVPLMLYALYRARRYKMARTRLRGIRFGMESAGAGYMWRAILYGGAAVASLGLLWPLMTFRLEKYMTDRSFWGDARMAQGGQWTGLYTGLIPYLAGIVLTPLGIVLITGHQQGLGIILLLIGLVFLCIALPWYRVASFAYLTRHKTMAGGATFDAEPSGWRLIWLYVKGTMIVSLLAGFASLSLFGSLGAVVGGLVAKNGTAEMSSLLTIEIALMGALVYLLFLSVWGTLTTVFISQPVLGYLLSTVSVAIPEGYFSAIRQRDADIGADADGFADALDVGGAF